jgi:hypothetical protein
MLQLATATNLVRAQLWTTVQEQSEHRQYALPAQPTEMPLTQPNRSNGLKPGRTKRLRNTVTVKHARQRNARNNPQAGVLHAVRGAKQNMLHPNRFKPKQKWDMIVPTMHLQMVSAPSRQRSGQTTWTTAPISGLQLRIYCLLVPLLLRPFARLSPHLPASLLVHRPVCLLACTAAVCAGIAEASTAAPRASIHRHH